MPGFPECGVCDFSDRPETCLAVVTGHRRYCELIAGGRLDYRRIVWDRTTSDDPPFDRDAAGRFVPDGVPVPARTPAQDATVPIAITLAVERCEHRHADPVCGCVGRWRCALYAKDVTWEECIACQVEVARVLESAGL